MIANKHCCSKQCDSTVVIRIADEKVICEILENR